MPKIKFNHGLKSTMPKLDFREPGITDDTEEVFVGGNTQNIQLAKKDETDGLDNRVSTLESLKTQPSVVEQFTATDGQTVFTLVSTTYEVGKGETSVEIDGIPQSVNVGYTETDSKTITLVEGVPAGAIVKVIINETSIGIGEKFASYDISLAEKAQQTDLTDNRTDLINKGINVKLPFGTGLTAAKGDGVTDDTSALQAIINYARTNNVPIFFPSGTYIVSTPLIIYGNMRLYGNVPNEVIIQKNTNTTATIGTRSAPARSSVSDNFNVDAVLIVDYATDGNYAYYVTVQNINLQGLSSLSTKVMYGIFCPRASHVDFSHISMNYVQYGFYTHDCWMGTLSHITVANPVQGITWADDGSGSATGTSITFTRCWVNQATSFGWFIYGLRYSSFNGIGCDGFNGGAGSSAYKFWNVMGCSVNGMGLENTTADIPIRIVGGYFVINGLVAYTIKPTSSFMKITDGANVVINAPQCDDIYTGYTSAYNIDAENNANVIVKAHRLPTNVSHHITDTSTINIHTGGNIELRTANYMRTFSASTFTRFTAVPTSATAAGNAGDWSADANYLYFCYATNTWHRIACTTW